MQYAHLHTLTNFSFLTGASHPGDLVRRAAELGYSALAITDEASMAAVVRAYSVAKTLDFKLIYGATFTTVEGIRLVALAPSRNAYAELCNVITRARRRAPKGAYLLQINDLIFTLKHCLIIWLPSQAEILLDSSGLSWQKRFKQRLWIGVDNMLATGDRARLDQLQAMGKALELPLVAAGRVVMHRKQMKPLLDTLTAIRLNRPVNELGRTLSANAEAYLKNLNDLGQCYRPEWLAETDAIAARCDFCLSELRYNYPQELVPKPFTAIGYLTHLTLKGAHSRWPDGIPDDIYAQIAKELALIEELQYEFYFLTVYDLVQYAKSRQILCQGRGSAANSVVCYCLHITNIRPGDIQVLFERFISRERSEPPDIDIDFEHQRREEIIQYIYRKYGRRRAALTATVITYRTKSAVRDVGKALGFSPYLINTLLPQFSDWLSTGQPPGAVDLEQPMDSAKLVYFFQLVKQLLGYPRHLSQHVGGFLISDNQLSDLVPLENAAMPERTIVQWDKYDLEELRLLKVDVLGLGMLTALNLALQCIRSYRPEIASCSDIPMDDPQTYEMLCQADSIGVFQVESRAQMAMLPRLQPRCFYDLVIEVAIVRPGPIQGNMVHPYLQRRQNLTPITYAGPEIKAILARTLGVPIFQEQAIHLAMKAAGFSGGQADELRRTMASWGRDSQLHTFAKQFIEGMLANGYSLEYAHELFEQIKGFGGYGFPESHSASFALLCYFSAWIKRHHPTAFYCALLNSQPLGFYTPAQLLQDAARHGVVVLPIEVNRSGWLSQLENCAQSADCWGLRLGFNLIRGLQRAAAEQLLTARGHQPFRDLADFRRRVPLETGQLEALADAGALQRLAGHRPAVHWQIGAADYPLESSASTTAPPPRYSEAPTLRDTVMADHAATGFSLLAHPMSLVRAAAIFQRCVPVEQLLDQYNGQCIEIAGLITNRQKPGTAKGIMFLTVEDETGSANVIVSPHVQARYRRALLQAACVIVSGRLEINRHNTSRPIIHLIAHKLTDCSAQLAQLKHRSRDFH